MNKVAISVVLLLGGLTTSQGVDAERVSDQTEPAGNWRFHFRWEHMTSHPRNPPQYWFTFQSDIKRHGSGVEGTLVYATDTGANSTATGSFTCTLAGNVCADGSMRVEWGEGTWEGFTFELAPDLKSGKGSVTFRGDDGGVIENSFSMQRKSPTRLIDGPAMMDADGIRLQVSEGLDLSAHVKAVVSEFVLHNWSFPNTYMVDSLAGPSSLEGTYVESVHVHFSSLETRAGIVITYGNDADPAIHGRTLTMTGIKAVPGTQGAAEWTCASEGIEDHYLPLDCQQMPQDANAGGSIIPSGSDATYELVVRPKSMFVHSDCEGRVGNPGEWVYEVNVTAPGQNAVRIGTKKYPAIEGYVVWADQTSYRLRGKLKLRGIPEKDLASVAIQLRATEWDPENPDPSMDDLEATEIVKYASKRQDGTVDLDGGRCAIQLGYNATWKKEK